MKPVRYVRGVCDSPVELGLFRSLKDRGCHGVEVIRLSAGVKLAVVEV